MHRVLRLLIFLFSFLSYFVLPSHPVVSCLFTYIWIPSIVCDKESAIHLWEWILRSCAIRLCFHFITSPRIAPHPIPSHPIRQYRSAPSCVCWLEIWSHEQKYQPKFNHILTIENLSSRPIHTYSVKMFGISYWMIPVFSGMVWLAMLLAMLLTWVVADGSPIITPMDDGQTIA